MYETNNEPSVDLPRSIGRPATDALNHIGVTTLSQADELSDKELLCIHGVGPKAVHILREAIRNGQVKKP